MSDAADCLQERLKPLMKRYLPRFAFSGARQVYHRWFRLAIRLRCWYLDHIAPGGELPPALLRFRVGESTDSAEFIRIGQCASENLQSIFKECGLSLEQAAILDFGCGCGRIHGTENKGRLSPEQLGELKRVGFLFLNSSKLRGILPDWYHSAFQNEGYIRDLCRAQFDEVRYFSYGMGARTPWSSRSRGQTDVVHHTPSHNPVRA